MKILLTGGGTGGHFYPLIAIAEELNRLMEKNRFIAAKLFYMAPTPFDRRLLFENNLAFVQTRAGKIRRYFSLKNIPDIFKTAWGIMTALWQVFLIYPDVVVGKGGYGSFPALFAAYLLRIPVVIHESDSEPGRVNLWAGGFARKIAVSYPEAAHFFPPEKVAHTGNPIRGAILHPSKAGAYEFLGLSSLTPTILVLGGSQGSTRINETLLEILPTLAEHYQIIHQTGAEHFALISKTTSVILEKNRNKERYKPFDFLTSSALSMAAGIATLVVSRAGSTIFEIATWGLPSIVIPIPESVSHDQTKNAFNYARSGACIVIEERNLTPHVLLAEINRVMESPETLQKMAAATKEFDSKDAAYKIAREVLEIAVEHEE